MRPALVAVLLSAVLAGCSASPEASPDPSRPLHEGGSSTEPFVDVGPDLGYDCDALSVPEAWYGHGDGSLWCVQESGFGGARGSIVAPMLPLTEAYGGWNGSAGHAKDETIQAHVKVLCWSGPCLADVTVIISSNGTEVARLVKQEVVVDAILLDGVWVDLEGSLSQAIPAGGVLSLAVELGGVGPLMLMGHQGSNAPWFALAA